MCVLLVYMKKNDIKNGFFMWHYAKNNYDYYKRNV